VKISFLAFCILISSASLESIARMPIAGNELAKKVQGSEIILIVESVGHEKEITLTHSGMKYIAKLKVIKVIKGKIISKELMLITHGYASGNNMQCCDFGERYLVFLVNGYPELEEIENSFVVLLKERDKYVSGADNAFSSYKIIGDEVIGFPFKENDRVQLNKSIKDIKKYIRNQKRPYGVQKSRPYGAQKIG